MALSGYKSVSNPNDRPPARPQKIRRAIKAPAGLFSVKYCTRNRFIALRMRHSMRVQDDDFDVLLLTLDDFKLHPLSPETVSMLND